MCGIAGFLHVDRLPLEAGVIGERMATLLAHRGPDGSRVVVDDAAHCVFVHRRLAINDLSDAGAQPMRSADGNVTLAMNGEVYAFKQLRAQLAAEGDLFQSRSDSEVLFGLYRRHGVRFAQHVRGEFAVVLYDARSKQLILTRDRFGVRPLYYFFDGRILVWASEAKAVLAHPAVPRRLSPLAALNQLAQVMVPGSSAFEGVAAVKPGHQLVFEARDGRLMKREIQYWDIEFTEDDEPQSAAAVRDIVEAVQHAVIDATVVRTETDAKLGVYLSGGVDSAVALGVAANACQSVPDAVTLQFDHSDYDESEVAQKIASFYGSRIHLCSTSPSTLYGDSFILSVWHSERNFYNTLGVAKMHLSAAARAAGLRAVLTGEGSDELFAGYPAFHLDASLDGALPVDAASSVLTGSVVARAPVRHEALDSRWGFTPAWLQPWIAVWRQTQPLLRDNLLQELDGYDPFVGIADAVDATRVSRASRLNAAQYTWAKVMLESQILNWGGDRVDMAHAIESRPVFLDHVLAETAGRVPAALRIRQGAEKWVLREAVGGLLPEFMRTKRKFPLLAPPAFRAPAMMRARDELVERFLTPTLIDAVGICDPRRVRRFIEAARLRTAADVANEDDKIINHLVGLHALWDLFVNSAGDRPS